MMRSLTARRAPLLRRAAVAAAWLLLATLPGALDAQSAPRERSDGWRATRVAKWTLFATAVAFGVWSFQETERADDEFAALRRLCEADASGCALDRGRYVSPDAERLFSATRDHDRRARLGIVAGQAAALGSTAFFIMDLRHGGSPDDIPYDPERRAARGPTLRIGVRLTR